MPAAGKRTRAGGEGQGVNGGQQGIAEAVGVRGFLEFVPDAIVGVEVSGRIVLVNRETEHVFGYPREELLGEQVEMLIPERFRDKHVEHRHGYFADPAVRHLHTGVEFYGLRSDGSEFPADIAASPVHTGDGVIAIASVRDLTDVREMERQRDADVARAQREARVAQSSRLESLGQLAGGVAHDFNNLLGVILNYADFVAQELEEGSAVHTDVLEIRRAAERATELTRQLLIFGRREAMQPQVLDLNHIVYEMERMLRRTLGEQVELSVDFAPELSKVLADPGQLEQVLVNLALNARDAMPEGGVLRIATASIDDRVRLTVADSGVGMEPEVVARAFEPFFSTKRRGEGTGLGLATVYGIVKAAGGEIAIESEPGRGTTFRVDLPVAQDEAEADASDHAAEVPPRGRGQHILVVEDEAAIRALAERILSGWGYRVTALSRGAEAISLLEDTDDQYELLLSDVVMPEMRGVELVRRAREIRPELPILLMSGYSTPLSEDERTAIASAPLLQKPFSGSTLLREVYALIDEGDGGGPS